MARAAGARIEDDEVYSKEDLVRVLFRLLMLRDPISSPNFNEYIKTLHGQSIEEIGLGLLGSEEFRLRYPQFTERYVEDRNAADRNSVHDLSYRCPTELAISPTPLRRILIVGQCLLVGWHSVIKRMVPGCECDFFLTNNVQSLSIELPVPISEYDFQLISVPLRRILPDATYFRLSYPDIQSYEMLFEDASERLRQFLSASMEFSGKHGLLTFVTNFILPQQNPMGRLLPRYDHRNFVYFVERLNQVLADEISNYDNAHYFDLDSIIATYGRRYYQDDHVWVSGHNADLNDFDFKHDGARLDGAFCASRVYRSRRNQYIECAWTELLAMYRTLRQLDMVKLVVVDLDDTLWRGVAVEQDEAPESATEGWPVGVVEALSHLKRRGVILAVLSKNEESLVTGVWQRFYGGRFTLDDFAIRKINWRPKAENFEEILAEANLLPHSVVYIDDNPVERAAIKAAFPEVRVFGPNPLLWRRILLWSAETQIATITAESSARTEMIRAQVTRETQRKKLSREEFLASLNVAVTLRGLEGSDHPDLLRALELVNKSNQFNTTGRRWTKQEWIAGLGSGLGIFVFNVQDVYTSYGLVGVVIVEGARILQFVMSCRVVGLEIEIAVVAELLRRIAGTTGASEIRADLVETELNLLVRNLWPRCGFVREADSWVRPLSPLLAPPGHVRINVSSPTASDHGKRNIEP